MNALKPYYDAILNEGKTNKLQSNENFVKKCTSKLKATLSGIINKPVIKKPQSKQQKNKFILNYSTHQNAEYINTLPSNLEN